MILFSCLIDEFSLNSNLCVYTKYFTLSPKYYPIDTQDILKKYMLNQDDLLVSLTGNVGRVGLLPKSLLPAALNQRVACLRLKKSIEGIDTKYLFHALNSDLFENACINSSNGIAQKNLSTEWLKDYHIPLYSVEEQKCIVKELDLIIRLIDLQRKQLQKLDELVKSRFIEMFGEMSLSNEKWKKIQLSQVIQSIEAGWSANGIQREKVAGEIAVLKVSAVTKGYFIPTEYKVLNNQKDIKKYVFPQKGDLLFSRANTKEMVGATAVVTEDYPDLILPDKLWKIELNKDANVFFIKYALSCENVRNRLSNDSTGTSGSMYNISMQKLKSLKIPLPPIELQDKFADFVNSTDKSKTAIQKSLDDLETLKKSLMQQYFA